MPYTACAIVTGGRSGHATTENPSAQFVTSTPVELGGTGEGVNPEQLFAVGWGACYQSALMAAAKEMRVNGMKVMKSRVRVSITIGDDGKSEGSVGLSAKIEVCVPDLDLDIVQKLAYRADEICPYSKATHGNIPEEIIAVLNL
ncbi:Ohr family peroxiredoxin [Alloscardovia venturai]|uniref:Ohr family peroxiredoxin n=1 Tax=Alloscardovia venturai TaxID=1769421 RepID=A0ABW2Y6J8_9BIFI